MNPDHYGWLRVRLEEPEQYCSLAPDWSWDTSPKRVVVEQADPVVSASAAIIEACERDGLVHDGVLRVGTYGHGLGVVEYAISEHPAGPKYRVLTLEGTDRDR